MQNIYLHSLGCEKNTVDGEHILAILQKKGFNITNNPEDADIIVINTCAFIEDSKKESIDAIFDHSMYKKYGKCKRLIVSGCMSERYKENFLEMFKEVDSAIGIYDLENILKAVEEDGFHDAKENTEYKEYGDRVNTGTKYSVYIRISDGCHANCSFCAIPGIRGEHRSRKIEDIVKEAENYAKNGAKEINLIAQETTFYGYDIYKKLALPDLLKALSKVEGIEWIRVLYQNPVVLNDEIIESFFNTEKVVPYFDIPLQHVDKDILKDMNRGTRSYKFYREMIDKIRSYNNDAVIRTSLIVGFPGETPESFKKLIKFVRNAKLDRVGVFTYSEEENTKALLINKPKMSRNKKLILREKLMRAAIEVSEKRLERFIGRTIDVLIEKKEDDNKFIGRSIYDAPEVDGYVEVYNENTNNNINIGDIVQVAVTHNTEYDLIGNVI
ncbi:30S ribosomal protein S12 methylthiotransferase RimO [Brachyspira hyodysenteriae]|uniref:30S ribosomal protein S12 methylthiotransferase RimO n=1 Tax=Brachyspira hyodysenteriae TaxID=159 RepID=UPI00063DABB8|nr:30S ribosomal protein S12 methylthiotransferase RimO [Brachyspira hyodysenteriae]KLI14324.1 2-methylthioadenine synthetase [Brachyspira hyodysenteriae]KLI15281.1 2-methylthioadenine synthetase [Brachyspira hyodysenteriae]KLI17284.1 2-methylthioadenine synthetase [Brachyspira hyodysenteriae]KLI22431.1 2-methylthioadenine synthetase [Brachyspira hyodysenteriae]KLI27102.1 2-methylthioadenine synthetase [Brachyspira hyodysenteriae]